MNFTAVFNGTDGSMGFIKGRTYLLQVKQATFGSTIHVRATEFGTQVPYSNLHTFMQNWSDIKSV